jgi:hypothetical protein
MSVRPPRLGLLIPAITDVSWLSVFEAALAAQTRFWGGSGNLIFPLTLDLADRELFWALADCFDADAFVTYAPSWADVREFAPQTYEERVAHVRRQVGKDVGAAAVDDFLLREESEFALDLQPTPEQQELLKARLAPFHHPGDAGWLDRFNATQSAGWPFTDATEFTDLPGKIVNPKAPGGAARKLLLTAAVGRLPLGLCSELAERGTTVVEEPMQRRYRWARIVVDRRRGDEVYPWATSDQGLATYHATPHRPGQAALVVGDTPWDFALFYALKRMNGAAWWLPSWLRRDQSYLFELGSALEYEPRRRGGDALVISASSIAVRDRVTRTISDLTGRRIRANAVHWREALPDEPLRLYERDNEGRTELVQLLDGKTLDLRTPTPRRVGTKDPAAMRWLTEIRGHDWTPIRHQFLGPQLLDGMFASSDLVRTTRDGIGYYSPGGSLIPAEASLESVVARPTLRRLTLLDQLRAILEPRGWTCEPSDKGIYAVESMRLFGGFAELCNALRDPSFRAVIDAYRDRRAGAVGLLLSSDRRRYLTWEHLAGLLPGQPAASIIDELLARGVLRRGLVLKCSRCRQAAWHPLGAVRDTFECRRCHLQQVPDRQSWLGNDEPVWSYRMAEVLFQFFENDGELPVLAVRDAFAPSERPLDYSYELELTPPDAVSREVDIFSADGYRLWIGEAKKNGRFEPGRLEFVAQLASLVDAYGVIVVTSQRRWPPATLEQARAAFTGFWPQLRMIAGVRTGP